MKSSSGTLGHDDFYPSHMEVIKGSGFMNSRSSRDQSEISERFFREHLQDRRQEGVYYY
jgi:hypothetical protein